MNLSDSSIVSTTRLIALLSFPRVWFKHEIMHMAFCPHLIKVQPKSVFCEENTPATPHQWLNPDIDWYKTHLQEALFLPDP